jgi:hypothetical protein
VKRSGILSSASDLLRAEKTPPSPFAARRRQTMSRACAAAPEVDPLLLWLSLQLE